MIGLSPDYTQWTDRPTQYIDCSHIESSTYIKYIGCFVTFFDGTAQQISNEDIGIYNLKNT